MRDARQDGVEHGAPAGLDARYEHLRHAVLHDRARAFPLGLAVLIAKGLTAWQRLLTPLTGTATGTATGATTGTGTSTGTGVEPDVADLTDHLSPPGPAGQPPALLSQTVSAQLVHALAGLAVALTGT